MKTDETSYVEILREAVLDAPGLYRGVCETCHYIGPDLRSQDLALSLLNRHRDTREHKTNANMGGRFIV